MLAEWEQRVDLGAAYAPELQKQVGRMSGGDNYVASRFTSPRSEGEAQGRGSSQEGYAWGACWKILHLVGGAGQVDRHAPTVRGP